MWLKEQKARRIEKYGRGLERAKGLHSFQRVFETRSESATPYLG